MLWVGEDKRQVCQQHSDPDDAGAWTEPELLFEAGDGCHRVVGDTNGETVAATLECYETDLFIQQAPDQGQAVVTQDLDEWQRAGRRRAVRRADGGGGRTGGLLGGGRPALERRRRVRVTRTFV